MTVKCHIHLDDPLVPRDIDNAPAARWKATKRSDIPTAQIGVSRSHTGYTYVARVVNSNGLPVVHHDWRFMLRVTRAEYDYLCTLLGKVLEFIDNVHVDDGVDHSGYIKSVALKSISDINNLDPLLNKFDVAIELVDLEAPA